MGLGKTFQGLAVAACYKEDWPLLIICPSSMRMSWQAELQTWYLITCARYLLDRTHPLQFPIYEAMHSIEGEELLLYIRLSICPLDISVVMTGKDNVNNLVTIVSYDLVPRIIAKLENKVH